MLLLLISTIPFIDKQLTILIYNLRQFHHFSKNFSTWILYFNILINLGYIYFIGNYKNVFVRYFIELFIINILFKSLLDRPRPRNSLIKTANYIPIYKIHLTKDWAKNQSFPSGHIATIFTTFLLFENYSIIKHLYLIILGVTGFCRVNLGEHHVSDCIWSLYICQFSYNYLKF